MRGRVVGQRADRRGHVAAVIGFRDGPARHGQAGHEAAQQRRGKAFIDAPDGGGSALVLDAPTRTGKVGKRHHAGAVEAGDAGGASRSDTRRQPRGRGVPEAVGRSAAEAFPDQSTQMRTRGGAGDAARGVAVADRRHVGVQPDQTTQIVGGCSARDRSRGIGVRDAAAAQMVADQTAHIGAVAGCGAGGKGIGDAAVVLTNEIADIRPRTRDGSVAVAAGDGAVIHASQRADIVQARHIGGGQADVADRRTRPDHAEQALFAAGGPGNRQIRDAVSLTVERAGEGRRAGADRAEAGAGVPGRGAAGVDRPGEPEALRREAGRSHALEAVDVGDLIRGARGTVAARRAKEGRPRGQAEVGRGEGRQRAGDLAPTAAGQAEVADIDGGAGGRRARAARRDRERPQRRGDGAAQRDVAVVAGRQGQACRVAPGQRGVHRQGAGGGQPDRAADTESAAAVQRQQAARAERPVEAVARGGAEMNAVPRRRGQRGEGVAGQEGQVGVAEGAEGGGVAGSRRRQAALSRDQMDRRAVDVEAGDARRRHGVGEGRTLGGMIVEIGQRPGGVDRAGRPEDIVGAIGTTHRAADPFAVRHGGDRCAGQRRGAGVAVGLSRHRDRGRGVGPAEIGVEAGAGAPDRA